ncbi:chromosome segregation SMC family protein [Actinomyces sp. oral taxon 897]|uniref:chromosome segregation SMC family protein n=1 Tax=Actinomyces sp. oral taxon 897 TaxID=2081702 RepID=UPI000D029A5A|nr:AAA family ATPase [Actinomyces sp. oral taxon 897]AVM62676.1 chromosome segregation protein SMC [Actinomyces sp. oral taxon 897]
MYLKTLTIRGFKSFASSTTLRLEPGITAVVGPNGSGKSNVVDALTWVMGEQGAKNLRGGSMADVIFAGAGSRPALGRAEVALTIDNTDGALPIDYTEVTIARTLFRGGGSEYQINGTAVRLLDVAELLSDTGLGRQMHSVVGQGRLDAVLSATPEDRRGFIEEAAGVLKHRRRKERALRKLDSMAADLTRLTDLAAELNRQLGPLARQAAIARRARTIQAEVRDATARLLADDVVQAQALLAAGEADTAALERRRTALEEAEQAARARLKELTAAEAGAGQRLREASRTWEELTAAEQSLRALEQVAAERLRGLAAAPRPAQGTDPQELERRAEEAAAAEDEARAAIDQARQLLTAATGARLEAEAAESRAESALSELTRREAERRETLARAGGRVASARSRHEAARSSLDQARAALGEAQERQAAAETALRDARGPQAASRQTAAPGPSAPGPCGLPASSDPDQRPLSPQERAAAEHERASAALAAARQAVGAATEARREAAAERATWAARRDTLALSLRSQDGTRGLAQAGADGILGPLSSHLGVERGWENAVAALLGQLAEAAVVAGEQAALAALDQARRAELGAVRLVVAQVAAAAGAGLAPGSEVVASAAAPGGVVDPPPASPEAAPTDPAGDPAGPGGDVKVTRPGRVPDTDPAGPGGRLVPGSAPATVSGPAEPSAVPGARPAASLVSVSRPGLAGPVSTLLHRCWVVRDVAAAQALREADPQAVVATRDGDVLGPGWLVGAGGGAASVLELAAAHEDAVGRARDAADAEAAAKAAAEAARDQEEAARSGLARALTALRRADAEAAAEAETLARLASAAHAARQEAGRARAAVARAEEEAARRTAELATATTALAQIEEAADQGPHPAAALEEARSGRQRAADAARQARAGETEARLALRTAEERERSGRGRAESLRAAARRERQARAEAARAERRRLARLGTATQVRDLAHYAAAVARASVEEAAAGRTAAETERDQALEASHRLRREVDQARGEIASLTDAAHREEVARAEQRARLEALEQRALSELGLETGVLVEEFGPHLPVPEVSQLVDSDEPEPRGPDQSGADPGAEGAGPGTRESDLGAGGPGAGARESDLGAAGPGADGLAASESVGGLATGGPGGAGAAPGNRSWPTPLGRPYVRSEQVKRLARAKRDLARLGKVNPLALEEHAALAERHRFLATQLADLRRSRAELMTVVEEIDARVQEVFSSAYADTAEQFEQVFDRLFPGGQGRLVLTDPDDMLTTGIEIEARPAGKKVKRLSLLSGGERSLVAVALLVAIFKARPSPFYVLDEVEAALDDTNLGRLLDILTELRASSQIIVITHQRRTMEVADALYGVTMRDGITTVVSQRLGRGKRASRS